VSEPLVQHLAGHGASGAALVLALVAGCGRLDFKPGSAPGDGRSGDGTLDDGGPSVCHTGAFAAPVNLGMANTTAIDWAPALSADGQTLYFGSLRGTGTQALYVAQYDAMSGSWSAASKINELSSADGEGGNPSASHDELALLFGQTKVFRSTRPDRASAWGARQQIVGDTAAFTSPGGPKITDDGQLLYFTATRTGHTDTSIWSMPAAGGNAQRLAELDTTYNDGWVSVTSDDLEMFYTSYYETVGVSTDIYRATRAVRTDPWTPQGRVAELVAAGGDFQEDADVSPDGRTLVFASRRAGGTGNFDVWITTRSCP